MTDADDHRTASVPIGDPLGTQPANGHAQRRWLKRELGRYGTNDPQRTTLVVIGGVHGNEPAGLIAAQRVLDTLQREQPTAFRGRLVVLAGNLAALNHAQPETRYLAHDLNRLFTDEQIAKPASTSPEHAQMQELLAALRSLKAQSHRMIVIDLHTTSAAAPPMVVLEDSIPARRFARSMPMPLYLGFEEELGGLLADRVTNEMGSVAMVIEGGQHHDPESIVVLEAVVWSALGGAGILPIDAMRHDQDPRAVLRRAAGDEAGMIYDIRYLRPIEHEDFVIAPGVHAGMPIVRAVTPIAIERGQPVTSPVRGRVFMPNMQKHKRVGDDGFFIVRRVGEGWLGLSARLRRQDWLHWLIAHMPGIYACPGDTLCVDAKIAAVLKRQIFHLLGYRLVRHDQRDGGRGLTRAWRGSLAMLGALLRGPIPGGPDLGDPRFWVVRRHRLDR